MPAPEANGREQDAVLWEMTGRYDSFGRHVVGEPRQIEVRWNRKRRMGTAANGSPVMLDGTVVTVEEIPVGSNLWPGTLDDWYGTGSAGDATEVHEVVSVDVTPDVKGREVFTTLGVVRHKDRPGPGE